MTGFQDRLNVADVNAATRGHPFVSETIFRSSLGSTNDLAKECAQAGAPEGLLIVADEQVAGRGRRQRSWWAPAGTGLLTSLLFRPPRSSAPATSDQPEPLHPAPQLMMLCALAAADAIIDVTDLHADLKWPNDLTLCGRKLAGLLAESVYAGDRMEAVIIGLGINVNMDFADAPPYTTAATSLRVALGRPLDRLSLLIAYVDRVAQRYQRWKTGTNPLDEWADRLGTIGQRVTARLLNQAPSNSYSLLSGIAVGVDTDGALLLRTDDGITHRLLSADVSLERTSI